MSYLVFRRSRTRSITSSLLRHHDKRSQQVSLSYLHIYTCNTHTHLHLLSLTTKNQIEMELITRIFISEANFSQQWDKEYFTLKKGILGEAGALAIFVIFTECARIWTGRGRCQWEWKTKDPSAQPHFSSQEEPPHTSTTESSIQETKTTM